MHVVVAGSGLAGLSTAFWLRRYGLAVTVVDAATGPATGASQANGGLLTPSMPEPWNAPGVLGVLLHSIGRDDSPLLLRPTAIPGLFGWGAMFLRNSLPRRFRENTLRNLRLAAYSLETTRRLCEEGEPAFALYHGGTLRIFRDAAAYAAAAREAERLQQDGLRARELDTPTLLTLEPALEPICRDLVGALHYPEDDFGDAFEYCSALARWLEAHDTRLEFGRTITGWERAGARVLAAQTASGPIGGDAFVLAAGSHSAVLARPLGLALPVRPVKGYSISVPLAGWDPRPRLPIVDDSLHAVATPLGPMLRIAGTAELTGFDRSIRPRRIGNLIRMLRQIYPLHPAPQTLEEWAPWAGLRSVSPDGVPILGETPIENLFLNTGHGHLGWTMAAGCGKAVAGLIAGIGPEIAMHPYSLSRFQKS